MKQSFFSGAYAGICLHVGKCLYYMHNIHPLNTSTQQMTHFIINIHLQNHAHDSIICIHVCIIILHRGFYITSLKETGYALI